MDGTHVGGGAAKKKMRTENSENNKPRENIDTQSRKRKSQTKSEEAEAKKIQLTSESGDHVTPTPQPRVSRKTLMIIEIKLVCEDEEKVPFEFPYSAMYPELAHVNSKRHTGISLNKQFLVIVRQASKSYASKKYTEAVELYSRALELCSKGYCIDYPFESTPEDIASVVSIIETKLVTCYLQMRKPKEALNHAHRSIILNPFYFRNHLRQAAAFRCLRRYSEAARSIMIADYIYWLSGKTDRETNKFIRLYWQAMFEEAIMQETSFSVLYTPFVRKVNAEHIKKIEDIFAKNHPDYIQHIYTDPNGHHILPQTTKRLLQPIRLYVLTLGFRDKSIGKIMERWSYKILPIFSDQKTPFSPFTKEEVEIYWNNTGKNLIPVMDFIRSSTLIDTRCPCSRGIEKLHYASILGCLERVEEQSQVIHQAMAELATLPYLQPLSIKDVYLLQSLMTDAMNMLGGISEQNVWDDIQKIGLIEDYIYKIEDNYLEKKRLRAATKGKTKKNPCKN